MTRRAPCFVDGTLLVPKAVEGKFWPKNMSSTKPPHTHMHRQNGQRDVGIILSHVCPPPTPNPPPPNMSRGASSASLGCEPVYVTRGSKGSTLTVLTNAP